MLLSLASCGSDSDENTDLFVFRLEGDRPPIDVQIEELHRGDGWSDFHYTSNGRRWDRWYQAMSCAINKLAEHLGFETYFLRPRVEVSGSNQLVQMFHLARGRDVVAQSIHRGPPIEPDGSVPELEGEWVHWLNTAECTEEYLQSLLARRLHGDEVDPREFARNGYSMPGESPPITESRLQKRITGPDRNKPLEEKVEMEIVDSAGLDGALRIEVKESARETIVLYRGWGEKEFYFDFASLLAEVRLDCSDFTGWLQLETHAPGQETPGSSVVDAISETDCSKGWDSVTLPIQYPKRSTKESPGLHVELEIDGQGTVWIDHVLLLSEPPT